MKIQPLPKSPAPVLKPAQNNAQKSETASDSATLYTPSDRVQVGASATAGSISGSLIAGAGVLGVAQVVDALLPGNVVALGSLAAPLGVAMAGTALTQGLTSSVGQQFAPYASNKRLIHAAGHAAGEAAPIQGMITGSLAGSAIGSALAGMLPEGLGTATQIGTGLLGGAVGWKIGKTLKSVAKNIATMPFHRDEQPVSKTRDHEKPIQVKNNAMQVIFNDDAMFKDAMHTIKNAKKSVLFESYLFNGPDGKAMADLLIDKAKEGVEVKVILDPTMQKLENRRKDKSDAPEQYALGDYLKKNGVEFVPYALNKLTGSLTPSEHAKILVVDEHTTYLGGTNIDDTYNQDTNVKIQGPSGKTFAKLFRESWNTSNSPAPHELGSTTDPIFEDSRIQAFSTSPSRSTVKKAIINNIREAKDNIRVQMFTITDDTVVDELVQAAKRGVKVELLLCDNKEIFHLPTFHVPNLPTALTAQKNNIDVKWYKNDDFMQMHSKLMTFDNKKTMIGSLNAIHNAFRGIHEYYFTLDDPKVTETINKQFTHSWNNESAPVESSAGLRILGSVVEAIDKFIF